MPAYFSEQGGSQDEAALWRGKRPEKSCGVLDQNAGEEAVHRGIYTAPA